MNTNAGPNSLGASGSSGTLYGGADSSAQMLQVLASSNVMPGYQNMSKDQVDWGLLAQQWIRMREWSQPVNDFVPTPPPPPSFHDTGDLSVSDCGQGVGGTAFDEQGEAPMEVEKEDDNLGAGGSALMLPVAAVPPGPHTIVDPTATAAVANWQAKMNQLYHMNLAGHQSAPLTGSTLAPVSHRDASSTESKPPPYSQRRIDRDVKLMAESVGTGDPGPPMLNGGKDYGGGGGGESVTMNEAKRKLLPAWIREGLEKMEREKQRQLEREQERRMWEEEQRRQRSAEDEALADWTPTKPETSSALRSHEEEDGTDPPMETLNHTSEDAAAVTDSIEDDNELWAAFVRTTMTDILLKVTGNLIVACVSATINKSKKRKAKQVQSKQVKPGLVTCTGALGLGIYGDSDEEDDDDEEESAGKEAISGADSQGDESTDDDLSDSAAVQKLEETIRRKHRDFAHTTRDVEQWISSVQLSPRQKPSDSEVADGMQHTTVRLPDDQANEHHGAGIGRDDGGSTSSNGDVGAKSGSAARLPGSTRDGETQPVNDKLYASQQFAGGRRRLEKRVSRFSELQEPRARLPLNPPPVPPVMTYKLGALSSSSHPPDQSTAKGRPGDVTTKRAAAPPNPADVLLQKANQRLAQQQQQRQQHHPPGVVMPPAPVLTAADVEGAEKNSNRYLASIQTSLAKVSEPKKDGDHPGGEVDKAAAAMHKTADPKESRRRDGGGRSGSRDQRTKSSHAHRERSERDRGGHHHQDYYPRRQRSRSKSSRSYTRSPHSVSRSTRSRSSRSRSRSKSHRAADHSSSTQRHHRRHRSDRSRHRHHSRSWSRSSYSSSRSRSRSSSRSSGVSQERSRSTERRRGDASTSKLFSRRPE